MLILMLSIEKTKRLEGFFLMIEVLLPFRNVSHAEEDVGRNFASNYFEIVKKRKETALQKGTSGFSNIEGRYLRIQLSS